MLSPTAVFLQVEGLSNQRIKIDGGDISKAATPLAFKNGADKSVVRLRE
jgi:hypothetical protein